MLFQVFVLQTPKLFYFLLWCSVNPASALLTTCLSEVGLLPSKAVLTWTKPMLQAFPSVSAAPLCSHGQSLLREGSSALPFTSNMECRGQPAFPRQRNRSRLIAKDALGHRAFLCLQRCLPAHICTCAHTPGKINPGVFTSQGCCVHKQFGKKKLVWYSVNYSIYFEKNI